MDADHPRPRVARALTALLVAAVLFACESDPTPTHEGGIGIQSSGASSGAGSQSGSSAGDGATSSGSSAGDGATSSGSSAGDGATSSGSSAGDGATSGGSSAGSTSGAQDGSVSIIVEPSDGGAALIAAITAAKVSVHMTMYMLTDKDIENALIARAAAGVEVEVVLNKTFPGTTFNSNLTAYNALRAAVPAVPVVWAPATFTYTHEKCVVIDGTVAWIMTMNASASSLTDNREYLAVDTITADVAEAEAQFAADFADTAYSPQGALLMSPVTMRPGLQALINNAAHTLDFEVEELSDSTMTTALCNAVARQVSVRGVISDSTPSPTATAALAKLQACHVTLVQLSHPYIHAKAIVADGASAYVGSANYSYVSLSQNRELGIITSDATAVALVAQTVAGDIAVGTPVVTASAL